MLLLLRLSIFFLATRAKSPQYIPKPPKPHPKSQSKSTCVCSHSNCLSLSPTAAVRMNSQQDIARACNLCCFSRALAEFFNQRYEIIRAGITRSGTDPAQAEGICGTAEIVLCEGKPPTEVSPRAASYSSNEYERPRDSRLLLGVFLQHAVTAI